MNKDTDKTKEQLLAELDNLRKESKEQEDELKAANQQLNASNRQLEASNQQLRAREKEVSVAYDSLNSSLSGVIITNQEGEITYCNPAFLRMFEYKDRDEVTGKYAKDLFTTEKVQKLSDVAAIIDQAKRGAVEFPVRRKDGTEFPVEVFSSIVIDKEENNVGRMASFNDITERKQMEEKLKAANQQLQATEQQLRSANQQLDSHVQQLQATEQQLKHSEQKFRSLFEQASVGVAIIDTSTGKYQSVNKKQCDIVGYTEDEILKLDFMEITHPDDIDEDLANMSLLKKGEIDEFIMEKRYFHKDGSIIWVNLNVSRLWLPGEETLLHVAICKDITERKQAEENLKTQKERLNYILEGTNVGTWEWNVQTGETIFNEKWANIIGYTLKEISPVSIDTWMKFAHPEDLEKSNALLEKHFNGELDYYHFESRMKHKDGSWIWALDRGKVITRDDDGKPLWVFGTHQDITERKQAEEELKESEKKYKNIYKNTPVMLHSIDTNGVLTGVSNHWLEVMGYEENEVIGKKSTDFLTETSKKYAKEVVLPDFFKKGFCKDIEYQFIKKNNEVIDVLLSATVEKDGKDNIIRSLAVITDITERKKSEEKLRESEARLQGLFETMAEGMILIAPDGQIVQANTAAEHILGLKRSDIEARNYDTPDWEILRPDGTPMPPEEMAGPRAMKEKRLVKSVIMGTKRPNGTISWINVSAAPLINEGGELEGVVGTFADITEQKKAEEKLRKSEEKYRSIVEGSIQGMVIAQVNPIRLSFASKPMEAITGYSPDELMNFKPEELQNLIHPDDRQRFFDTFRKRIKGEEVEHQAEYKLLHKEKDVRWIVLYSSLISLKGEPATQTVFIDITEQKRNEQIQSIIHNISNAVITSHSPENFLTLVKDELGKVIDTTNFFVALYDEKTDRISLPLHHDEKDKLKTFPAGKTLTNYVIKTGKSLLAKKALIEKLIKSGEVEQVGNLSEVWLGVPLKSHNKITGIFAVQSYDNENAYGEADVKMLEIISHQISLSLERLKAEEDLKLAKEKVEEMNRVKSHFFSNMSHELRTPFIAIRGYAEFLLETLTDPEDKELAEAIITGADRLTDTLDKILSLTKLEVDKREIELKEMNLPEVINDSFKVFSKTAEKKNLNFIKNIFTERSYNEEELIIKSDEEALRDLLNNLLSNAIKYTEKGSIELKTDIEKRNEGEFLVIKVTDTGIGIPKEKQALIWDEFRQVSEGRTRSFQGTGLGLSITKKRVDLLGGKISLESEEGKGSSFMVELPILRTGQVEKSTAVKNENDEPTEPVETNSLQITKKILYVENEKEAQNIVHKTLSNNYTIEIAINAEEALEKVKSQKYDALLIDINLVEGMDGVQLMEMIREMPEYKETPMTAITAFAADSDREEFLARGFTHYISKPFALKELKKLVQEMFS